MNNPIDFEKYLEHVCFKENPTVLDDDMPDFFDAWLGNQNGEDYIIDCDRCGEQHEYLATTQYTNAYLCPRCSRARSFDADNPILYPITNEDNLK